MSYWIAAVGIFLFIGGLTVIFQRSIKNAVITFGIVSLASSLMFAMMRAYDVAITEASIGAVLTTALFFWTVKRLEEDGFDEKK